MANLFNGNSNKQNRHSCKNCQQDPEVPDNSLRQLTEIIKKRKKERNASLLTDPPGASLR